MKSYIVKKIEIKKLYLYLVLSSTVFIVFLLAIIILVFKIFPNFKYIEILFIALSLLLGTYILKFAERKSSQEILIKLNTKFIQIGIHKIPLREIKDLELKSRLFWHYPKLKINHGVDKELSFRISKYDKDFNDFSYLIKKVFIQK